MFMDHGIGILLSWCITVYYFSTTIFLSTALRGDKNQSV
jgi:hypothetical protein